MEHIISGKFKFTTEYPNEIRLRFLSRPSAPIPFDSIIIINSKWYALRVNPDPNLNLNVGCLWNSSQIWRFSTFPPPPLAPRHSDSRVRRIWVINLCQSDCVCTAPNSLNEILKSAFTYRGQPAYEKWNSLNHRSSRHLFRCWCPWDPRDRTKTVSHSTEYVDEDGFGER